MLSKSKNHWLSVIAKLTLMKAGSNPQPESQATSLLYAESRLVVLMLLKLVGVKAVFQRCAKDIKAAKASIIREKISRFIRCKSAKAQVSKKFTSELGTKYSVPAGFLAATSSSQK